MPVHNLFLEDTIGEEQHEPQGPVDGEVSHFAKGTPDTVQFVAVGYCLSDRVMRRF